ncbi:alpha/beta hydrolase [Streptomyces europaeiscabiei]|uniref:alpha/beta hydrolase n=1 Tax=Streptomyces europaeiscabiei TaxID=146819 RepID=UPI0029B18F33|nr:alpha/beta hydrolase [Streptomyces europaeiscabiei]MDX3776057.1 alpha/beta hydrolase [Streptomyces europaeiscabiei]
MRAAVLYGTVGAVLLSALGAVPAKSDMSWTEDQQVAVAAERAADEGIRFGKCPVVEGLPDGVRCGTVKVPLDYALPDGRQISLTLSRVGAKGEDAGGKKVPWQGALVFNPGGPGASGMFFPLVGQLPGWKRVAAAYDLIGYAPRGVGRSAPLSCQDPKRLHRGPSPAPTHPSEAYKKERIARARTIARGCAQRNGNALRHYHSRNNARDLDVLRAALGEPRLTFMGASYGTYFGALYASLFPSHVRRMVFDSAVNPDPEQIWYRNNLDQSAAFEERWADFRAWAARHHKVYGLGDTPQKVLRSYERAAARLAARPAGGKVGPGQLQGAFLQAAYYDDHWPQRALALSAYLKGDPKPLVQIAGPYPEVSVEQENASAVYTAVECNDGPWPTQWRVWDRDNTRLARTAPFETWDNVWTNLPCAYWSGPRQEPLDVRTGPGELPPTLILAAERDAAAPYEGAIELHRRLWGSVLVTERDAGNHGVGWGANKCVNAYLEAYLLEGRLPERRAACAPRPEPSAPRVKG